MDTSKEPIAYTIPDLCSAYSIGRTLAHREIAGGRLKARKIGNRTLILRVDAEEWANTLPSANSKPN